jgi:hypothetical protein
MAVSKIEGTVCFSENRLVTTGTEFVWVSNKKKYICMNSTAGVLQVDLA